MFTVHQFLLCEAVTELVLFFLTLICLLITYNNFQSLYHNCSQCNYSPPIRHGLVKYGPASGSCIYGNKECMDTLRKSLSAELESISTVQIHSECLKIPKCRDPNLDCLFLRNLVCKQEPICLVKDDSSQHHPNVFALSPPDHRSVCSLSRTKIAALVFLAVTCLLNFVAVIVMFLASCCPTRIAPVAPVVIHAADSGPPTGGIIGGSIGRTGATTTNSGLYPDYKFQDDSDLNVGDWDPGNAATNTVGGGSGMIATGLPVSSQANSQYRSNAGAVVGRPVEPQ
eukprot:Filipodium_phascolosomae@DN7253_c0_g1_i1.p1